MNKTLSIALVAGLLGVAAASQAQTYTDYYWVYDTGAYLSTTDYYVNGGATAAAPGSITRMIMDDASVPAYLAAAQNATTLEFAVVNGGANTVSCRPRIRFWNQDSVNIGPTGVAGPGSYITSGAGYTFNPITFTGLAGWYGWGFVGTVGGGGGFALPANGKIWMGMTFDNGTSGTVTSTSSLADINLFGGARAVQFGMATSSNQYFKTTSPGSFFGTANPVGSFVQNPTTTTTSDIAFGLGFDGQKVTVSLNLQDTVGTFPTGYTRDLGLDVKSGTNTVYSSAITGFTLSAAATNIVFTIPASITTPIDISLDGSSWLKKTITFTPAGGFNTDNIVPGVVNMQNGDTDFSGEVDAADIDKVIAAFGSTFATEVAGSESDVDVSGEVDAADIDIVIANFGGVDG